MSTNIGCHINQENEEKKIISNLVMIFCLHLTGQKNKFPERFSVTFMLVAEIVQKETV